MMFPYAPLPPPFDLGGTKRNLPFLRQNLKRHDVSVLSFGTPEEENTFRSAFGDTCREIRFIDRKRSKIISGLKMIWLLANGHSPFRLIYREAMQAALDDMTSRHHFDVIHTCTQFLGHFRFPPHIPKVTDAHEVTYDLHLRISRETKNIARKIVSYLRFWLEKAEELRLCAKFDVLITTTERDREVFKRDLPAQRIVAINNGVDPSFLEPSSARRDRHSIVFTGKMSYYPNLHGILIFLDQIFPLVLKQIPDAKVYVVGAEPPKQLRVRSSQRVIVTGFVQDVRPYVAASEVFIIPLWIGGGIRGKALEAMAMRKPIVSTPVGCESIRLQHEYSALIASSAEEFALSVIRLLQDSRLAERLSNCAHETVLKHYDWESKGGELNRVYEMVVPGNRTARRTTSRAPHSADGNV